MDLDHAPDDHTQDDSDVQAAEEVLGESFNTTLASWMTHQPSNNTEMRCLFVSTLPEIALKQFPVDFSKVAAAIQKIIEKKETSSSYVGQYVQAWIKFQNWGNVVCGNEETIIEEIIGWNAAVRVGTRTVPDWPAALRILDWIREAQKEVKAREVKEGVCDCQELAHIWFADTSVPHSCSAKTQDLELRGGSICDLHQQDRI